MNQIKPGYQEDIVRVEVIANLFGVTVRRVQQLTQDGVINTVPPTDGRPGRMYQLADTVQKYTAHLTNKAKGRNERADSIDQEKLLKERAIRQKLEIELALLRGEVFHADAVEKVYGDMLIRFKTKLLAMPSALAPQLADISDPTRVQKIIKDQVYMALNEFASYTPELFAERRKEFVKSAEGAD